VLAQFFYPANTVLLFTFWLLAGLTICGWRQINSRAFKTIITRQQNNSWFSLALLLLAGWLLLAGFAIKFWLADAIFAQAGSNGSALVKAVRLNPFHFNYRLALAKYYLQLARQESAKSAGEEKNNELIKAAIDNSLVVARQAVNLNPQAVAGWETLGIIYRDIRLMANGSEPWAIDSFSRAFKLEPTNPVLATELGKAYFNAGQNDQAKQYLTQAIALKNDYYEAKFVLANVYVKTKDNQKAEAILNELASQTNNPEVYYEQGRFYFNQGEIAQAIKIFNQVIELFPDHSNALYSLGLAYETQGKKDEALKYFQKVLQLNPGNEEVMGRIKELKITN